MSEIHVLKVKWKVFKSQTRKGSVGKIAEQTRKKENSRIKRKRLVMKKEFSNMAVRAISWARR